jgi:regulator of replication initiation timing
MPTWYTGISGRNVMKALNRQTSAARMKGLDELLNIGIQTRVSVRVGVAGEPGLLSALRDCLTEGKRETAKAAFVLDHIMCDETGRMLVKQDGLLEAIVSVARSNNLEAKQHACNLLEEIASTKDCRKPLLKHPNLINLILQSDQSAVATKLLKENTELRLENDNLSASRRRAVHFENSELRSKMEASVSSCKNLSRENAELRTKIEAYVSSDLGRENTELRSKIEAFVSSDVNLNLENAELRAKVQASVSADISLENAELRAKIKAFVSSSISLTLENAELRAKVQASASSGIDLGLEVAELRAKFESSVSTGIDLCREIGELRAKFEASASSGMDLSRENVELRVSVTKLQAELRASVEKLDASASSSNDLSRKNAELCASVTKLQAELRASVEKLDASASSSNDNSRKDAELLELRAKLDEAQRENAELRGENAELPELRARLASSERNASGGSVVDLTGAQIPPPPAKRSTLSLIARERDEGGRAMKKVKLERDDAKDKLEDAQDQLETAQDLAGALTMSENNKMTVIDAQCARIRELEEAN